MAEISFRGLDEFALSLKEVAELPDEVVDEILTAGADVTVEAQRAEARKLGRPGGYWNAKQKRSYATGGTALSIKKGKVKVKDGKRVLYLTPVGTRARGKAKTRNAEIAFLNEFGTKTIQARGFLRKANEESAAEATAAQAAVYNKFLEAKGL